MAVMNRTSNHCVNVKSAAKSVVISDYKNAPSLFFPYDFANINININAYNIIVKLGPCS